MVKIVLRERESAQEAVRRLRKILDRSGLKRESAPPGTLREAFSREAPGEEPRDPPHEGPGSGRRDGLSVA